jgi:hypothetical protein
MTTIPQPPDIASLLELSDERDQWERLCRSREREAYRHGYSAGRADGYRDGYSQAVIDWKVTAAGMTNLGGPTSAELDRRRYPPDGRLSWIQPGDQADPLPDDFAGQAVHQRRSA